MITVSDVSDVEERKIFDDFQTVECQQCERWWLNQCDGCKDSVNGSKMPCNSFLATRNITIPLEIKALKKEIKWLKTALIFLSGIMLLMAISNAMGW